MKSIDFLHFKAYTDITQSTSIETDVRLTFADMLYKNMNGVMAHDIAMRIYKSNGPIVLNETELELVTEFSKGMTPIFQDSLAANIKDVDNESHRE